jgi:hypothetical protein
MAKKGGADFLEKGGKLRFDVTGEFCADEPRDYTVGVHGIREWTARPPKEPERTQRNEARDLDRVLVYL